MQAVCVKKVTLAAVEEAEYKKGKLQQEGMCKELAGIWDEALKKKGDAQISESMGDIQALKSPFPGAIGRSFHLPKGAAVIEVLPTQKFGTFWMIDHGPKLIKEVNSHYRTGQLLSPPETMAKMFEILARAFPDQGVTEDHFMFTCSEEQTKKFRKLIRDQLGTYKKKALEAVVQEEIQATLQSWTQKTSVNATTEMQRSASRVATQVLFGETVGSGKLGEAITCINLFIQKEVTQTSGIVDKAKLWRALSTFKSEVLKILKKKDEISLFKGLSDQEIKGLIYSIFFAGQETVATLASVTLMELACHPKENLNKNEVHNVFVRCMHKLPPVHASGRKLKTFSCFKISLTNGEDVEIFLHRGDTIITRIKKAADCSLANLPKGDGKKLNCRAFMPFSAGKHRCSGERIAKEIMRVLITEVTSKYDLTYVGKKPNPPAYYFTSKLTHPVELQVKRKET